MTSKHYLKVAAVAGLVAAAFSRRCQGCAWTGDVWFLLAFGILNVVVPVGGTEWVRALGAVIAAGVLIWPGAIGTWAVLVWFVWTPVFLLAWAVAREKAAEPQPQDARQQAAAKRARIAVAAIIVAVAIGSVAYRMTLGHGLQQTAALFVGIPALMAIVVVFAVSPRSSVGVACKAVTIALLTSMLLLQEGILCIAMSAPLFYAVAIAIATLIDFSRRRHHTTTFSVLVILATTPFSLEGVTELTTIDRNETISVTKRVVASVRDVESALTLPPRFDRPLPAYLRAGFPRPVGTRIARTAGVAQWIIEFRGGEMYINGMEPRTGDLVLALEEWRPGLARWRAVSDTSHMTHFLRWREIVVRWTPADDGATDVTWTVHYERGLDPAWYFGPWERYAMRRAAGYLIDAVATP